MLRLSAILLAAASCAVPGVIALTNPDFEAAPFSTGRSPALFAELWVRGSGRGSGEAR